MINYLYVATLILFIFFVGMAVGHRLGWSDCVENQLEKQKEEET